MASELKIRDATIILLRGDITKIPVDVIVNAANSALVGGGGVDGAIHRAGGPGIMRELEGIRPAGGCPTGSAVVTGAGKLPAKWVVHAVGPRWRGGSHGEKELLASAYRKSLEHASARGAVRVSFPSISTGVYGYPVEEAAPVALQAVASFLAQASPIREALFVLFDDETLHAYERALVAIAAGK